MSVIPSKRVLIVDDEPRVCKLMEDLLSRHGLTCASAHTGRQAQRRLLEEAFDVAVLDLLLPDVGGIELLGFIAARRLPTRAVCVTGAARAGWESRALRAGAYDLIEKPFDPARLVEAVLRAAGGKPPRADGRGAHTPDRELRQMLLESAGALVSAVEAKDPHTRRHSEHVAFYAERLARNAGVEPEMIESIRIAALLHDIGKIAVPDAVLTKPGPLTPEEFALVRQHPEIGAAILEKISLLKTEAALTRHHHENWDGTGYPAGLKGQDIPLGARILNLADSIDAMLMQRTYKPAFGAERMMDELARSAGTQFEPRLAAQALQWCRQHPAELILQDPAATLSPSA